MAVVFSQTGLCSSTCLAAIRHSGNSGADQLLGDVARQLKQQGYRVGGVVRSGAPQSGSHPCDMYLEELTTGETVSIFQNLGPGARGCQLDPAALEHLVGLVDASLESGLDILIVNKFGKREADGGGFSSTISQAVCSGTPVVVTLNHAFEAAWQHFCGGEAETIAANRASISHWIAGCLTAARILERDRS